MPSTSEVAERVRVTPRRTRRDAAENDERVLAAAVTTMLREGRHVPMAEIAAEAGVGVATLYRKYPNRDALLAALTEQSFELLAAAAAEVAQGTGDGLDLLSRWWDCVIALNDRLVLPLRGGPPVFTEAAAAAQTRLHASLRAIIARGQDDRTLRDDLTLRDVVHFGTMLATPFHGSPDQHRIVRRQKQIHLDGVAGPQAPVRRRRSPP